MKKNRIKDRKNCINFFKIDQIQLPVNLKLAYSFTSVFLFACQASPNNPIPRDISSTSISSTLAVGDKIRVSHPGAPELDQVCKIQAGGQISLPIVGVVMASGRTSRSLQDDISSKYVAHLNDPTVFVSVEEPSASVYVSGEVAVPRKIPLDRSITVLEAVMEGGGFSKLANPKKVYVIRNEGGTHRRYVLNLSKALNGNESEAFYLRPFDVVYVERSNW